MDDSHRELSFIIHNRDIVFFENEKSSDLTTDALYGAGLVEGQARAISPETVHRAALLFQGGSVLHLESGRYLKLTQESYEFLRQHGVRNPISGTIRRGDIGQLRNSGQFVKNLAFEAGSRAPAMISNAAGIVAQAAIEKSLADIKGYLREHGEKLDTLLNQPRNDSLDRLRGLEDELLVQNAYFETHNRITQTGWENVAGTGRELKRIINQSLRELEEVANGLKVAKGDGKRLQTIAASFKKETTDWLAILAHALQLLDMYDRLSVVRVVDHEPGDAVSFTAHLIDARDERIAAICNQLREVQAVVRRSVLFSDSSWVRNPGRNNEIVRVANEANAQIDDVLRAMGQSLTEVSAAPLVDRWDALRSVGTKQLERISEHPEAFRTVGEVALTFALTRWKLR